MLGQYNMRGHYLLGLPFLRLHLYGKEIEPLVDTDFNGELLLSAKKIREFCLKRIGFAEYITADGSVIDASIYTAEIEWLGVQREVSVISSPADFTLVGMGLLREVKTTLEPAKDILLIESNKE